MNRLTIVLLAIFLAACQQPVLPSQQLPPYIVLLTQGIPSGDGRCTGIAVDEHTVITMYHCVSGDVRVRRVVTALGQDSSIEVTAQYPEIDIVVVTTERPLRMTRFATFADADHAQPAFVFAACPHYFVHTARRADYDKAEDFGEKGMTYHLESWHVAGAMICGGDSGGPLIQAGHVVGFMHAILSIPWYGMGHKVYVVPVADLRELNIISDYIPTYKNARQN